MCEIVVTGGAGRLGQWVIRELLAHDYSVLAVDRQATRSMPCQLLQADLTDASAVHNALAGARAVIHLGAVPGPSVETAATTYENNVLSTYHVLESAAAHGLKKVVPREFESLRCRFVVFCYFLFPLTISDVAPTDVRVTSSSVGVGRVQASGL